MYSRQKFRLEGADEEDEASAPALLEACVSYPTATLGLTFGLFFLALSAAAPFARLRNTELALPHAEDRLGGVAAKLAEDFLIQGGSAAPDAVLVWCDSCELTSTPGFLRAQRALEQALSRLKASEPDCAEITWDGWNPGLSEDEELAYLSRDGTASVLLLYRNEALEPEQISGCVSSLRSSLSAMDRSYDGLRVGLGTPDALAMVSQEEAMASIARRLMLALPLLTFVLYLYLGNFFKALTAPLSMVCSAVLVRALAVLAKRCCDGFNFSKGDSAALFVQTALALNFAVLFWDRFGWERQNSPDREDFLDCLRSTLRSAGLVILLLALVIALGFMSLIFYPDANRSGHLAVAFIMVTSVGSVAAHSIVLPTALAATFPSLYEESSCCFTSACLTYCFQHLARWASFLKSTALEQGLQYDDARPGRAERCFRLGAKLASRPPCVYLLPALASVAMVPLLWQRGTYRPFYDAKACLTDSTLPEYAAMEVYRSRFAASRASPSLLLLTAEAVGPAVMEAEDHSSFLQTSVRVSQERPADVAPLVQQRKRVEGSEGEARLSQVFQAARLREVSNVTLSREFGNLTCALLQSILNRTQNRDFALRAADLESAWWDAQERACRTEPILERSSTSFDGMKQLVTLYAGFGALSPEAERLTKFFWEDVEPHAGATFAANGLLYRFRAQHWSEVGEAMVTQARLPGRVPAALTFAMLAIAIAVSLFFRSVAFGVKSVLSVVVPILASYGVLVALFQNGWLRWAGVKPAGGVAADALYESCGMLMGLAVGCNVVLFARVQERRAQGYDNSSAVQMGLVETGPTMTMAGTLMVCSYVVMSVDNLSNHRMLACIYLVGVVMDTCVVRNCIAPTLLLVGGWMNYWPGKMPPETKSWNP